MELITDRAETDSLLGNEKGIYGYADLNRVEAAVAELMALGEQMDIHLSLDTKTDWEAGTLPTESQLSRYLSNVRAIKNAFGISTQIPQTMRRLNWNSANNIEKVLQLAFVRADQTIPNFLYCGELFAGEE